MPEEEKKDDRKREGETTQTDSGQAEYEKKIAELEAQNKEEVEKLRREMQQKEEMLDSLTPYVDWEKATGTPQKSDYTESDTDKSMEDKLRKLQSSYDVKLAAMQFRIDNPDLKPYENTLVGPAVQRLIQQNPRKSQKEILDMAAGEVRNFLKSEREKGKKEAEETDRKQREEAELASGLGSSGDTAPETVNAGETNEEYVKSRREGLAKMKNPAYSRG